MTKPPSSYVSVVHALFIQQNYNWLYLGKDQTPAKTARNTRIKQIFKQERGVEYKMLY